MNYLKMRKLGRIRDEPYSEINGLAPSFFELNQKLSS